MEPIKIKGANQHNLKNVSVDIPKNKLVTITGVSGSGKSSLALDTLFAEGQRRYAESLNSYVRQFLSRMPKPQVEKIENLCPAISIDQKVVTSSSRSTVGTLSETYDYLKLLFARVGKTYSPVSGKQVKKHDEEDVWRFLKDLDEGIKFLIVFAINKSQKELSEYLELLQRQGYVRVLDGNTGDIIRIDDLMEQGVKKNTNYYVIKDRGVAKKDWTSDDRMRYIDSIESTFHEGDGICLVWYDDNWKVFDEKFSLDGMSFELPSPDFFSFNNSYGACKNCEGFGNVLDIDEDLVIPNRHLSVYENAVACWKGDKQSKWKRDFMDKAANYDFPVHRPIKELSSAQFALLWNGNTKVKGVKQYFDFVQTKLYKIQYRVMLSRYRGRSVCRECNGTRIRQDASYVKINDKNIIDVLLLSVQELLDWVAHLELDEHDQAIARNLIDELEVRLGIMNDIGLGYLSLSRAADTLSGGESQRIHLTRIIGSNLSESLYVLDEPSIGLHPRDSMNLLKVLRNLKSLQNTVVVVEHEEVIIENSDYIIDVGPGAGVHGGEIVAKGKLSALKKANSLTAQYLSGDMKVHRELNDKKPKSYIKLSGAEQHNLKDVSVKMPINRLISVCGVSGSGKSTLVRDILYPAMLTQLGMPSDRPGRYEALIFDTKEIENVEYVDQNPIGKSSRSNPITYIKAYDDIRKIYANQKLSKIRGYKPGHFSFNTDGGRCPNCNGEGEITVQMQFLADVKLECDVCLGKQFKDDVLEVKYKGVNIHELLQMNIEEAYNFFSEEKRLQAKIEPLLKVGLGYMSVGQSSSTLSGGEAQRVKLASYIAEGGSKEKKLFIFDEPTTGLHFHDVQVLLKAFGELLAHGHTIVLVEHNLDVIRSSDWVIELGPEGGAGGGYLLYEGSAEGIMKSKKSVTKKYL